MFKTKEEINEMLGEAKDLLQRVRKFRVRLGVELGNAILYNKKLQGLIKK